jgi:hypothetical protein
MSKLLPLKSNFVTAQAAGEPDDDIYRHSDRGDDQC